MKFHHSTRQTEKDFCPCVHESLKDDPETSRKTLFSVSQNYSFCGNIRCFPCFGCIPADAGASEWEVQYWWYSHSTHRSISIQAPWRAAQPSVLHHPFQAIQISTEFLHQENTFWKCIFVAGKRWKFRFEVVPKVPHLPPSMTAFHGRSCHVE